jgi:hypothetical protein
MRRLPSRPLLFLLAALTVAGCGGGSGGTGTLAVQITDGPFPATEGCLAAAYVDVDGIEVQGEGGWIDIPLLGADPTTGVVRIDLLQLRSGIADNLALGDLPTGTYHQIRLHLVGSELAFSDGSPSQPFTVPSGDTSGLKINVQPHFVVASGQTTPLLLDVVLTECFHTTGLGGDPTCDELKAGETTVVFRPLVRAVNPNETGVVSGTVTDAGGLPVGDAEVSAFPAGTVVDDTTVPAAATFSAPAGLDRAAEGSYALALEPGSYDLYVRAQGATAKTLAASGLTVAAGAITTQDVVLP